MSNNEKIVIFFLYSMKHLRKKNVTQTPTISLGIGTGGLESIIPSPQGIRMWSESRCWGLGEKNQLIFLHIYISSILPIQSCRRIGQQMKICLLLLFSLVFIVAVLAISRFKKNNSILQSRFIRSFLILFYIFFKSFIFFRFYFDLNQIKMQIFYYTEKKRRDQKWEKWNKIEWSSYRSD